MAVDLSTQSVSVGVVQSSRREWQKLLRWICRQRRRQCGCGGSFDTDTASGCGAVEQASVLKAAAVDLSTETASRQRQWICRHSRCQWVWSSRAGECGEGGSSGSVDRDGVNVAAVDLLTQTVPVDVVQSSWRVQ